MNPLKGAAARLLSQPASQVRQAAFSAPRFVEPLRSFCGMTGSGTALHSRVALPGAESRRSIVSERMLEALTRLPDGKAAVKAFQFQPSSFCFAASEEMRQRVASSRGEASGEAQRVLEGEQFTAKGLMDLNSKHGPVVLGMYKLVQDGQGAETYTKRHAAVLVSHFQIDAGRNIGVVLDGNDLQSNETMKDIKGWMADKGIKSLHDLGETEFTAMEKDLGYDVRQTGFRLVDLDSLVAAAQKEAAQVPDATGMPPTNEAFCDTSLTLDTPLVPKEQLSALRTVVAEDPTMVERFG